MDTWIIEGRSDFRDHVVAQIEAKTLIGAFRIFGRDFYDLADYTKLTIMKVTDVSTKELLKSTHKVG